ncbi:hypothetical protein F5B22DRAFT_633734 [Xylaria bambusicola]|uniref:uncharacterized protein n=1 Tax=Xylaria bambusicola TaxID=326684 RepID=UPI0020085244|nr:uncharacterized protein F5B22DRAFT_633734 [Xylaria bambusicola]KAI0525678.1 hypothetical protein F5B22DRAFT_633734 [Xylaria bambusicola]
MAVYQPSSAGQFASRNRELPSRYTSIVDILAGRVPIGRLISVMGLVKDYQVPIPTNGNHHKCTITIYDKSVEYDQVGLSISIFRQPGEMPRPTAGDVLVIHSVKVQSYRDTISLIANKTTTFYIYSALEIPEPPQSAEGALQSPQHVRALGAQDHEYVSCLYHFTNKKSIPDKETFQNRVDQSARAKDKFCKLENVVDHQFCDIIVNVVKAPFDQMDKATFWVSDYTENSAFHKFSWDGAQQLEALGDQDGYLTTDYHTATKWAGPFGKRSMQITCFEPHASQVKSEVQLDQWIRIRNLRIKFGKNGLNLEGTLHSGGEFAHRQIDVLKWQGRDDCDPRLKDAIRRKKDYENLKKKQMNSFAENARAEDAGMKRTAENSETPKLNSKKRRTQKRAAAKKEVEELDKQAEERLGLNDLIRCEHSEQPTTAVSSIVDPVLWKTTVEGEEVTLTLPFTCANYRTNVRVVDFRPPKLESFATWRASTEYDVLSDCSSDSDSGSDGDNDSLTQGWGEKIWEWRFALQLEDADPKSKGENNKFWAVVNNVEGQLLTGLDACDLRKDPDVLSSLREQLFRLWGNLEELKRHEQNQQITNLRRVAANQPPPSSPVCVDYPYSQRKTDDIKNKGHNGVGLSNKPFSCCIRQYGVSLREPDPQRADAGEGRRWARVFGLFGTKIHSFTLDSPLN